jgi:chromatin segregation and condensation protein Rec8/ScpA/Scc1 (kleisin family)
LTERKEKPYYLRKPWDILFRENKLDKVSPWDINLVQLLASLLEEMERVGIDYRIAGTAVNSSVYIYLKKAEMLLAMEEPPVSIEQRGDVYLPPPVPLPFRFEFTTTSVQDLINALERALQEDSHSEAPRLPTLPIPVPNFLDFEQYLLEIEARSDELLEKMKATTDLGMDVRLSRMMTGLNWLDVVRLFMMLLFLAQKMEIDLDQDEDETDVKIKVREKNL